MATHAKPEAVTFIEIAHDPIEPGRPYTDKTSGMQKMTSAKQPVYIHQGARYPIASTMDVDDVHGPLPPGIYLIAGNALTLKGNDKGYVNLGFNARELRLVPLEAGLAFLETHRASIAKAA